jgi:hypothetical protein
MNLGWPERFRTLQQAHELTGIVDQHRQVLRTDVDVPALVPQGDQRHHLGIALTEKADGFAHTGIISLSRGLRYDRCHTITRCVSTLTFRALAFSHHFRRRWRLSAESTSRISRRSRSTTWRFSATARSAPI